MIYVHDLKADPLELTMIELDESRQGRLVSEILDWRQSTIFKLGQEQTGRKMLFDKWLCRWDDRVSSVKYVK